MESIITINNLYKTFERNDKKKTEALKGISFDVKKGECLGIVGESGSGKSTIARLLTGLIPASSGDIIIEGKPLKGVPENIQMVFQNPVESFNPRKTFLYSVGEGLKNQGMKKAEIRTRAEELFESCGLSKELLDKYPHQVSGGQCQRAAIARALALEPSILICDEATSSLDVTVQKQIIELLDEIRSQRNLTILFICHNLPLVEMFCERAIILKEGEICRIYQRKTEPTG